MLCRRCAKVCEAKPVRGTETGCLAAALLCRSLLCCAGAPLCYAVRTNACATLSALSYACAEPIKTLPSPVFADRAMPELSKA